MKKSKNLLHVGLFLTTFVCTTFAGAEWISGKSFLFSGLTWEEMLGGLHYSVPFLAILTAHEFGHYFAAKYYHLKVTLPYYIPVWFFGLGPSIGTMGAFIQIKSPLRSRQEFFDVGVAGPLAGFVLAVGVIYYGFTHLPPIEYVFAIHPEYAVHGADYAKYVFDDVPEGAAFALGTNLLFEFFKYAVVEDPSLIPPPQEMIHYPYLLAGFLACFFTALNLIPIGQLDGGHILYGLIGYKRNRIASLCLFVCFIYFAGLGLFSTAEPLDTLALYSPVYVLYLFWTFRRAFPDPWHVAALAMGIYTAQFLTVSFFPTVEGYPGWLLFGFLIGRVLGIYHPPALHDAPLDTKRKLIGWLSLLIFILCFSPTPFIL